MRHSAIVLLYSTLLYSILLYSHPIELTFCDEISTMSMVLVIALSSPEERIHLIDEHHTWLDFGRSREDCAGYTGSFSHIFPQ